MMHASYEYLDVSDGENSLPMARQLRQGDMSSHPPGAEEQEATIRSAVVAPRDDAEALSPRHRCEVEGFRGGEGDGHLPRDVDDENDAGGGVGGSEPAMMKGGERRRCKMNERGTQSSPREEGVATTNGAASASTGDEEVACDAISSGKCVHVHDDHGGDASDSSEEDDGKHVRSSPSYVPALRMSSELRNGHDVGDASDENSQARPRSPRERRIGRRRRHEQVHLPLMPLCDSNSPANEAMRKSQMQEGESITDNGDVFWPDDGSYVERSADDEEEEMFPIQGDGHDRDRGDFPDSITTTFLPAASSFGSSFFLPSTSFIGVEDDCGMDEDAPNNELSPPPSSSHRSCSSSWASVDGLSPPPSDPPHSSPPTPRSPSPSNLQDSEEGSPPSRSPPPPPRSLEDGANPLSAWTLSFLTPLLRLGARRVLTDADVGVPSQQDRADLAYRALSEEWAREMEGARRKTEALRERRRRGREEAAEADRRGARRREDRERKCRRLLCWRGGGRSDKGKSVKRQLAELKKQRHTDDTILSGARSNVEENEEETGFGRKLGRGGKHGRGNKGQSKNARKQPNTKSMDVEVEPNLSRTLVRAFGTRRVILAVTLAVLGAVLGFAPIFILNDLVRYFETGSTTLVANPWVEVVGLAVFPAVVAALQARFNVVMQHLAVFCRTGLSTLIFRKSLSIGPTGRAQTSTGQVVNMMSNDANQLMRFLQFAGTSLVAPVQILISLILIFRQVGHATWVGVAFMVLLAPVNTLIFTFVARLWRRCLRHSDARVRTVNDALGGIRTIKFHAWEGPFVDEIGKIRSLELEALTKLAYTTQVGFSVLLMSAPIVQILLVFVTYVHVQEEPLTASKAFTTVALFNMMRFPFAWLPMGFLHYIQGKIAVRRIASYLSLPELANYVMDGPHPFEPKGGVGREVGSITMRHCSFAWVNPDVDLRPLFGKKKKKTTDKSCLSPSTLIDGCEIRKMSSSSSSIRGRVSVKTIPWLRRSNVEAEEESLESSEVTRFTLRGVSCAVPSGHLVAVVGEVGSGKSSLLSAILGEMEPIGGQSRVYIPRGGGECNGEGEGDTSSSNSPSGNFTAYCAQSPWVVNDTVRGNIVFGRPFEADRYDEVVRACALLDDLAVLPAGDGTEIGERGITMSGGQKARVCLARALYSSSTRVLLMDDPLSAVDAHVGAHLFREAITGAVTAGVTRVLVTHQVHLLPLCDSVIVVRDGTVTHQGKYADLVKQGVDRTGAVLRDTQTDDAKHCNGSGDRPEIARCHGGIVAQGITGQAMPPASILLSSSGPLHDSAGSDDCSLAEGSMDFVPTNSIHSTGTENSQDPRATLTERKVASNSKLIGEEGREEGSVACESYYHYTKAGGCWLAALFVFAQSASKTFEIGCSFWLSKWAGASVAGSSLTDAETSFYVIIYALLSVLSVAFLVFRGIFMAAHRLRSCRLLHQELTSSIMRAPVSFFDVTPTGRILNRFAHDMDKLDLDLTQSLNQSFNTVFSVMGAFGAISAATKGTFLVPLVPVGFLYHSIQKWFRRTTTELQRVYSMTRSPIFADFSQTLTGTSTIRAYGEQARFFSKCKSDFDKNNSSYVLVQLCFLWIGLRLDILGGLVGAFIGSVAVGTASSGFIPAGWLGLALTYSIDVTNYLKHGVRMVATLEGDFSSVERVLDCANNVEPEAPDEIPEKDPPEGTWPERGEITVSNANMRYRNGPLVLRNLSFHIRGGEKVGVVGRTGSGKSSLMAALFRITELEKDGGKIVIDGRDTSEIGTRALRSNLSIIPQDPLLFSNTVRFNLDPFGGRSDAELWAALTKVHLVQVIAALPKRLDEHVAEGGENFSQGQRQLMCIARSLLSNSKVLIMDEATASIDSATDATIQDMIRDNFSHATVLTIAHRLNTIMDSDRIMVLNGGEVAEFDSPTALLSRKGGIFASLVRERRGDGAVKS